MDSPAERVLIAGGGIAGLAAAAALGRQGIEVDLVEIQPADSTIGGIGISLPTNALQSFKAIGILEECMDAGHVFDAFVLHDSDCQLIVSLPCPPNPQGVPGYLGIGRRVLSQILTSAATAAGATIRYGTSITEFDQDPDSVSVAFSDGRQDRYDLVVGAEGIKSELRRQLFGFEQEPVATGYGCWRVRLDRDPNVISMEGFVGIGSKAGLVPINEESMYLYHVTTETGNPRHDPAHFPEILAEKLDGYTGRIADIREMLPSLEGIVYSPLEEVRLPSPWNLGRILIIGDAAHAVVPHLSQGGSLCLEDGAVLGDVLGVREPVSKSLTVFMDRRYERARHLQELSHKLLISEMDTDPEKVRKRDEYLRTGLLSEHLEIRAYMSQVA